jgi:hypothetical protein
LLQAARAWADKPAVSFLFRIDVAQGGFLLHEKLMLRPDGPDWLFLI